MCFCYVEENLTLLKDMAGMKQSFLPYRILKIRNHA